jgi:hypothetical protein
MSGSTFRTSISAFIVVSATAAPGLAPIRRYVAHHSRNSSSFAIDGARSSIPTGFPQSDFTMSMKAARCSALGAQG